MVGSRVLDTETLRSLIDYLDGVAIWIVSEPREFDYVSAGAEDIWGLPPETLYEEPFRLLEAVHPEDRELVRSEMEVSPEHVEERTYESRAIHPDGTVRWVLTRQIPVRDDTGDLRHVVGICTDITEQKRRERELEALNRVLRHDVRNDVSVIVGWGELLETHLDEEGQERLEKLLSAANNVVDLTEMAHEYAETVVRGSEMNVKPVSLRAVLRDEVALRREVFPHAEFRLPSEVPQVEVLANELLPSVFRNVLSNAVQHNDADEPVVDVEVERSTDEVVVRIADNGPGIPPELRESLFATGVSGIDSVGTWTGLGMGLSLVRTLVEQYGGEVRITDNTPTGTVFHIHLVTVERSAS